MSNDADEQEKPAKGRGRSTLVIALTIGLIVGAGAGSLVVGPLLAESEKSGGDHAEPLSGADLEAQCEALFAEWEVEMRPPAPAAVYTIENVVLNPAQSGGTRFLMASVGFGMRDAAAGETMATRDAELRDIVIRILGSRTVQQLAETSERTKIKEEMRSEVARLVGQRALLDIYFPQFVIQ